MVSKLRYRSLLHLASRLVLVLVLAFSLGACSAATSGKSVLSPTSSAPVKEQVQETGTRSNSFPQALGDLLRQDLGTRLGIASSRVRLVKTTAKTWPNGCLGLAKPDEFCTEMLVEGWQVVLTEGKQEWIYHTDRAGRDYRIQAP